MKHYIFVLLRLSYIKRRSKWLSEKKKGICPFSQKLPSRFTWITFITHITSSSSNNNNNNSVTHVLSYFSLVQLCNPMDLSPPGSSVCWLSRQEYWSVSPSPPSGNLPDPRYSILTTAGTHNSYVSSIVRWDFYHLCHLGSPSNSTIHESIRMN